MALKVDFFYQYIYNTYALDPCGHNNRVWRGNKHERTFASCTSVCVLEETRLFAHKEVLGRVVPTAQHIAVTGLLISIFRVRGPVPLNRPHTARIIDATNKTCGLKRFERLLLIKKKKPSRSTINYDLDGAYFIAKATRVVWTSALERGRVAITSIKIPIVPECRIVFDVLTRNNAKIAVSRNPETRKTTSGFNSYRPLEPCMQWRVLNDILVGVQFI